MNDIKSNEYSYWNNKEPLVVKPGANFLVTSI